MMSDAAIASLVTGAVTIVTMVVGFLTLWVKLMYSESKIDDNTRLTKAGTIQATFNAKEAKAAAISAADKTDELASKLNGQLDEKISGIVKEHTSPIIEMMRQHAESDDNNMAELRKVLSELKNRK